MIIQFPAPKFDPFREGTKIVFDKHSYLSTEEVAQLFGFSVRTISGWAAEWQESGGTQGLPAFKMGRSWRFERAEIQAYIDSKKIPVQPVKRPAAIA